MCLVEVEGLEKAVASCLTEVSEGMVVYTESLFVKKARESVLEELLINHPLDCPICDQAGECDLQDQAKNYGVGNSKFYVKKRSVEDKFFGPLIKTIMTRCIHCTRCVRFGSEIAGVDFLGTFNRGGSTEIGSYVPKFFNSEISGNVIDLCPVGALTSKPFRFRGRSWEMRSSESIDMTDSLGSNIYINFKGRKLFRVLPKSNINLNDQIISDKARFSYDGNNKNRILNVTFKSMRSTFEPEQLYWSDFLKTNTVKECLSDIHFVINPDIGVETLASLKRISLNRKKVRISCVKSNSGIENVYLWGFLDKINDISVCNTIGLIYSLNPKIECALINTKLRIRLQNSLLTLFCLTGYYFSDIKVKFSNLNLSKSMTLFEGRLYDLSKIYLSANSPLFLTSNFFSKRGISLFGVFSFLKSIFKSIKIIKTSDAINFEAIDYFNIDTITTKKIHNITTQVLVNVEDTLPLRKRIIESRTIHLSLNSHAIALNSHVKFVVPVLSHFEDQRILLNLEQRVLITNKTYSSYYDARNLANTLRTITKSKYSRTIKHNSVFWKFINNALCVDKNYKYFIFLGQIKNYVKKSRFMKYPTKGNLMDFYCSNRITKSSVNMIASSLALRSITSNFATN